MALSYVPPAVPHSFSELGLQMWLASLSPLRRQAPFLLWDFVPAASHPGRPFPSLLLIHICLPSGEKLFRPCLALA